MAVDMIDRLESHRALGEFPRHELEWLAANGTLQSLETGDVLTAKGAHPTGLFVVLSGRIAIFVDRGAGPKKIMEWAGGEVTGLLPYSRMAGPPGDTVAQEPTEILSIPSERLPEMTAHCHGVTSMLVHVMVDRARAFTSSGLMDEKLVSLGKLSAGLAHELNNPASAIERSAALLVSRLEDAERAARTLGATSLSAAQLAAFDTLREASLAASGGVLSPLEHAEREAEFGDWLVAHGLDAALAEPLSETSLERATLDRLATVVEGPALDAVLRSAAAGSAVRRIALEILEASTRISALVLAVKGFTHMDQAMIAEPVDLLHGLRSTVAVLQSKARAKAATISIEAAPELPRVLGFAGELNQVWANLIDNALDAIPASGHVQVLAAPEDGRVVVRIVDDGPGIPAQIRERIFEPFFTTKGVGQGTGLGLDITRRLLRHSNGNIAVDSRPGHTEFRVDLPLAGGDGRQER